MDPAQALEDSVPTDPAALRTRLRQVALLAALDDADLDALATTAEPRDFPAGAPLFRQGEPGDGLWMLLEGEISISLRREGAVVELNRLGPGSAIGEMALIDGEPRSADAVALGAAELLFLPRERAMDVLSSRPAALLALLRMLCARLRRTSERVADAADEHRSAEQRFHRSLDLALDCNALTHLPGGLAADRIAAEVAASPGRLRALCYFDLKDFKPFNDIRGWLEGNRALLLFADTLGRHAAEWPGASLCHVGGDDFFLALPDAGPDAATLQARLGALRDGFSHDAAQALYTEEERATGTIEGLDRDGKPRGFALLSCVIGVLVLAPPEVAEPPEVGARVAALKDAAKHAPGRIALGGLA
jgi:CRP-like cAMP-binding protein